MQSKHQISRAEAAGLMLMIQKASGLNQRVFDREIGRPVELEVLAEIKAAEKRRQDEGDEKGKFELPPNLNPEQHLFDLTFNNPDNPIRIINHGFCQYDANKGYWASIPDEKIEAMILRCAEKATYPGTKNNPVGKSLAKASNVKATIEHAVIKLWHDQNTINNHHLLAFQNGTVCTKTGKLSAHSPSNYITAGVPHEYMPNAECPKAMQEYIASSFGEDQTEYVRAAIGLILDLTAPDKFIHLVGGSGTGKGTFIELLMKTFGPDCISPQQDLSAFESPDERHKYLANKRVFLVDDLVGFVGKEIGGFYTGVERKIMAFRTLFAKRSYNQALDLRAIIASTGPINTKHSSAHGWKRRCFPLPTIGGNKIDRTLGGRLEECLGEIISWVLSQPKDQRNAIIENPEHYNPLAEEYFVDSACSSSSVWNFVESCLKPVEPHFSDIDSDITVDINGHIYSCYRAFCAATNKSIIALNNFKGELRHALPSNYVGKKGKAGRTPARFVYITTVNNLFEKTEIGTTLCNPSNLSSDGVLSFKNWAKTWGSFYPYQPGSIPTVTSKAQDSTSEPQKPSASLNTDEINDPAAQNVADDTEKTKVTGVTGVTDGFSDEKDVCVASTTSNTAHYMRNTHAVDRSKTQVSPLSPLSPDNSLSSFETLTVTQGMTQEIASCQQRIIDASTAVELEEIQSSAGKEVYSAALNAWRNEGLYKVFYRKLQRLLEEEESVNS